MASVNFMKIQKKDIVKVKALIRHNDKEKREQTKEHSNKELDKSLSKNNWQLYDYDDVVYKVEERYAYLDEIKRVRGKKKYRKDAIGIISLDIKIPNEINCNDEEEIQKYWNDVVVPSLKSIDDDFNNNLIGAWCHLDEVHSYYNDDYKQHLDSMKHFHIMLTPTIDKELNAKQYLNRSKLIQLNKELDNNCKNEYNVGYNKGKGKYNRNSKSVEELKVENDIKQKENLSAHLTNAVESKQQELNKVQKDLKRAENGLNELKNEMDKYVKTANKCTEIMTKYENKIDNFRASEEEIQIINECKAYSQQFDENYEYEDLEIRYKKVHFKCNKKNEVIAKVDNQYSNYDTPIITYKNKNLDKQQVVPLQYRLSNKIRKFKKVVTNIRKHLDVSKLKGYDFTKVSHKDVETEYKRLNTVFKPKTINLEELKQDYNKIHSNEFNNNSKDKELE